MRNCEGVGYHVLPRNFNPSTARLTPLIFRPIHILPPTSTNHARPRAEHTQRRKVMASAKYPQVPYVSIYRGAMIELSWRFCCLYLFSCMSLFCSRLLPGHVFFFQKIGTYWDFFSKEWIRFWVCRSLGKVEGRGNEIGIAQGRQRVLVKWSTYDEFFFYVHSLNFFAFFE